MHNWELRHLRLHGHSCGVDCDSLQWVQGHPKASRVLSFERAYEGRRHSVRFKEAEVSQLKAFLWVQPEVSAGRWAAGKKEKNDNSSEGRPMKGKALLIGNSDGIGLATTKELLNREWRVISISSMAGEMLSHEAPSYHASRKNLFDTRLHGSSFRWWDFVAGCWDWAFCVENCRYYNQDLQYFVKGSEPDLCRLFY